MKKVLFVASMAVFVGLSFGSCKKDYTCTCTVSTGNQVVPINDAKKKDATDACDALQVTYKLVDPAASCKLD
ncbi:MAG: hypothetical protein EOP53_10535 [Sphingobacteriales bacterium]|nr:MAG: hypothetical protein EOP53_10535 [Sphingobacteriales bacterium]